MGTHDQNGRGITGPGNGMRGPSGRPLDRHDMRDGDDREQEPRGRRDMYGREDEYGQGQSGYGSGRQVDDRGRGGRSSVPERGFGTDERFTSRENEYWLDRGDRPDPANGARAGLHRGKGPLNYTRSDERIREAVCEALTDDHDVDASNIDVVVKNGEVTLSGTVEDRRQKRLAEDVAERCGGVKDISNQLKIGSNPTQSSTVGTHDKPRA